MRHVAQQAPEAGYGYVKVFDNELEALDALPLWMTRLFMVLVRRSAYSTGQGTATYLELQKALRPLQPRSGRRHYVPDGWAIYRALCAFERARIVGRNTGWSQRAGAIFYELAPRKAPARPKPESAGGMRRTLTPSENEQRRGL